MTPKKKILVVDDDENIRGLLKDIFQAEGYIVEVASDGKKGFEKACTEQFDLITMDIRMPNWDGVETILGLNLVNHELKFLIISGYINEIQIDQLKGSNHVLEILSKPFDTNYLIKTVKEYLQVEK
jgi:CheY-like chemotaxis protein